MRERKAVPDQPTCLLDADLLEVFVRQEPERGAEHPNEVERAEPRLVGELADRDRARVFCLEQIADSAEGGGGARGGGVRRPGRAAAA